MRLLLPLTLLILSACSDEAVQSQPGTGDKTVAPPPVFMSTAPPQAQIRSFDQMNETMSALTGVPRAATASRFENLRGSLPPANSLAEFNGAQQAAVVQLAAPYCAAFVDRLTSNSGAELLRRVPRLEAYRGDPDLDLTADKLGAVIESFHASFWGGCEKRPALSATDAELRALIESFRGDFANEASLDRTSNYLRILCLAFLTSSCVTTF